MDLWLSILTTKEVLIENVGRKYANFDFEKTGRNFDFQKFKSVKIGQIIKLQIEIFETIFNENFEIEFRSVILLVRRRLWGPWNGL